LGVTLDQVRTNARGAAHGAGTSSSRPTATKNMTFQCLVRGWQEWRDYLEPESSNT
jgi:hypothetical protein